MMRRVVAIPARYGSTRFPGKPLALLAGKPMLQHTYEKAAASRADAVLVATDDRRIFDAVTAFGGTAVMTSASHRTGTDRIYEAVRALDCDIVVNVQGDEPLLPTAVIDQLMAEMEAHPEYEMATVAVPAGRDGADDPNLVKVVFDDAGRALYFSRSVIPFLRQGGTPAPVWRHWGIYAYRRDALERFVHLPPAALEECEKLEQLRALAAGMHIKVIPNPFETIGIDTPADLAAAEAYLKGLHS